MNQGATLIVNTFGQPVGGMPQEPPFNNSLTRLS
jgi:hypothetical protein